MVDDVELGQGKTCFVVSPIGDKLSPHGSAQRIVYEKSIRVLAEVIEPACSTFGLDVVRSDKISDPGEIPEQVFTYLRDAEVVVADLSDGNPNVMYELGLRHSRAGKITIPIGDNDRLPFDVNTIRTNKFLRTEAGLIEAKNTLIESLRAALSGKGGPAAATRVWMDETTLSPEEIASATALSMTDDYDDEDGPDEAGMIEILAEGEEAVAKIGDILDSFSEELNAITALTGEITPALESAESFSVKLTLVKHFSDTARPRANAMEAHAQQYLKEIESVDAMVDILADSLNSANSDEEVVAEGNDFISTFTDIAETAAESSIQMTEALNVVKDMPSWSKTLKPLSRTMRDAMSTVLRGNAMVASWGEKVKPGSPT